MNHYIHAFENQPAREALIDAHGNLAKIELTALARAHRISIQGAEFVNRSEGQVRRWEKKVTRGGGCVL